MTEPLDPDTLARGERALSDYKDQKNFLWDNWLHLHGERLLAIARDHADAYPKK